MTGWRQLAHYLIELGLQIVITGSHDLEERHYIQETFSQLPIINLAGQLHFYEVAELISHCAIYVGPDTAVTHLAAATGVPTIALYGPTNHLKWAPWPAHYTQDRSPFIFKGGIQQVNNVILIQGLQECVPCHREGCEGHLQSRSQCLEELEATTVIKAIRLIGKLSV
jgi:heptosyltransferase-3